MGLEHNAGAPLRFGRAAGGTTRALVNDPKILIADELTGNLMMRTRSRHSTFQRANIRGTTKLLRLDRRLIEHSLSNLVTGPDVEDSMS
jgi:ABC-type ATPase involved in cell division